MKETGVGSADTNIIEIKEKNRISINILPINSGYDNKNDKYLWPTGKWR